MPDRRPDLLDTRVRRPQAIAEAAASRRRPPSLLGDHGKLMVIAADHPARGVLRAGERGAAMADRRQLLERLVLALSRPGVNGVLGTADVLEDLLLLGALENKVVFGSMNRGGLASSVFELDDRFTGYDAATVAAMRFEGGKMLLRIDADDPGTVNTLEACGRAVTELADRRAVAMVEPFISRRVDGRVRNELTAEAVIRSIGIAAGIGATSAYTWLKVPVVEDMERVAASTTLPLLLLGGEVSADQEAAFAAWRHAASLPGVMGMVVGRSLLFPPDDDVAKAVDAAVAMLTPAPASPNGTGDRARVIVPPQRELRHCGLRLLELEPGGSQSFETGEHEVIVLPLAGGCSVECEGETFELEGRDSVFSRVTDFAYVPRDAHAFVASEGGGRFALCSARARKRLPFRYGPAEDVPIELRGAGLASRQVNNFAAPQAFEADRIIAVEVLTPDGCWSSYPPHKHDVDDGEREIALEEIYYFEVQDGPDGPGFGYQRVYGSGPGREIDVLQEVRQGDTILVPHGYHGPSMAAPGYHLYYLNVMAGASEERAWRFTDDPGHAWIRATWESQDIDPRLPLTTAQAPA
jgi:5-deoxy-glucuronate isomerase